MLPFTRVCRRRTPLHMIPGRAMPSDSSRPSPRADAAGVRLVEAPAVRRAAQLLLLGAALICLVAAGGPELEAKDVIPGLIASGETGGIAVFPLPGTKPVKRGIVVPEDFALPV